MHLSFRKLPLPHLPTNLVLEEESEQEATLVVQNEKLDDPIFETNIFSCELHLLI